MDAVTQQQRIKMLSQEWYWKNPYKQQLWWIILKDVTHREVGFKPINPYKYKGMDRGKSMGTMPFLIGQLKMRFFEAQVENWHFYRSIECIKICDENNKPYKLPGEWHRYGFDFITDFDGKKETIEENIKQTFKEGKKILKYYNKLDIPFHMKFSGQRGLHFQIPWKGQLDKYFRAQDYPEIARQLMSFLVEELELDKKIIDFGLYGEKKLWRVVGSLHATSGLIATPITTETYDSFIKEDAEPNNIIKNGGIKEYPLNNPTGSIGQLHARFIKGKSKELSKIRQIEEEQKTGNIKMQQGIINNFKTLNKEQKKEIIERLKKA